MKKALACLLCLALPAVAEEPEQQRRAQQIFDLSNSFGPPVADLFPGAATQAAIMLNGCDVTLVQVTQNLFAQTFDAGISRFDLSHATLETRPDGRAYAFSENAGTFGRPSGYLRFEVQTPFELLIKEPSTENLSLEQALAAPLRETFGTARFAPYINDQMTSAAQIETLAAALLDYKRDFCAPSS